MPEGFDAGVVLGERNVPRENSDAVNGVPVAFLSEAKLIWKPSY